MCTFISSIVFAKTMKFVLLILLVPLAFDLWKHSICTHLCVSVAPGTLHSGPAVPGSSLMMPSSREWTTAYIISLRLLKEHLPSVAMVSRKMVRSVTADCPRWNTIFSLPLNTPPPILLMKLFSSCQDCDTHCCDASTCKLTANATCATGECCDLETCQVGRPSSQAQSYYGSYLIILTTRLSLCQMRPATYECRREAQFCDLSEYCNGKSEYCPADVHKIDGTECSNKGVSSAN